MSPALRALAAGVIIALAIVLVYAPGLAGGFQFDDYKVIVNNPTLALESPTPTALLDAALSTNTGPLKRPVSMLSFAFDRSLSGLDPGAFKRTNLILHTLNALLVLVLASILLNAARRAPDALPADLTAAALALVWAVHPANLSPVLFVVQRMTLLATFFMLLGLIAYCVMRRRQREGLCARRYAGAALLCLVLGLLSKESAILLVAYCAVVEWLIFRAAGWPAWLRRPWPWAALAALALAAAALVWPDLAADYRGREFTLADRLLTECRVLGLYVHQVLVPDLSQFALFHDDVAISRGLLDPPTTALALVALFGAIGCVVWRRPLLLAAGLGWFLAGHLLESTVLPLELMHEHRNYLAGGGLMLIVVVILTSPGARWPLLLRLAPVLMLAGVLAALTAQRAGEWSDEWLQLAREARDHPQSARSQYEFARLSIERGSAEHNPALIASGVRALEQASELRPNPRPFLPYSALLKVMLGSEQQAAYRQWLDAVMAQPSYRLKTRVFVELVECQAGTVCPPDAGGVHALADNILGTPGITAYWRRLTLEWLAIFYFNVLGDHAAAIDILRDLVANRPHDVERRLRLAQMLDASGDPAAGRAIVEAVKARQSRWLPITNRPLHRRLEHLLQVMDNNAAPPGGHSPPR